MNITFSVTHKNLMKITIVKTFVFCFDFQHFESVRAASGAFVLTRTHNNIIDELCFGQKLDFIIILLISLVCIVHGNAAAASSSSARCGSHTEAHLIVGCPHSWTIIGSPGAQTQCPTLSPWISLKQEASFRVSTGPVSRQLAV